MNSPLLQIGPHVTALPIVHGSGDFAWEIRNILTNHHFDCLAVPLPPTFLPSVENAILKLPTPSIVIQRNFMASTDSWNADAEENEDDQVPGVSYVPIDPCQGVIAAIRSAMGDRIPRQFIDLETSTFEEVNVTLPDAYALKQVSIEQYSAAVLPHLVAPQVDQWRRRVNFMAHRLKELSVDYRNILLVVGIQEWPWIRQAFQKNEIPNIVDEPTHDCENFAVDPDTYYFLLGEIPFITQLYELARANLEDDAQLTIDGVKELLLTARQRYKQEYGNRARKITPRTLSTCLKYIRNLTLIDHRMSPQLSSIVTAAKQIVGDGFALSVLEESKAYSTDKGESLDSAIKMGIGEASLPDGEVVTAVNRLPGPPLIWTQLELVPKPDEKDRSEWSQRWNPYSQCSWPPEDEIIENFRQTVFDRAMETMGADLARTEKFTTSVKDGIDIRDTIRNWHEEEIYVKVLPPNRGKLDCAVMLFDSPADPREYPWRTTWFAEHKNESTLCFFASNYLDQPVGPGICLANYGGAMFLFPPVAIPDIWSDPRLDYSTTLEERLLSAACLHSECPHIALVSSAPPGSTWKQIAKNYKKKWVHLPLSRFSDSTIQQLRMVHVLNGKEIRSFASEFIRKV